MTQEQNSTPSDTFIEKKMEEFRENIFEVSKIRPLGKEYPYRLQKEAKDWIENFLKSSLQEQLNQFKEMITEYDEIYINEEVRQAINRMKWKLTDLLK
jgi:guanylate kinase